MKLKSFINILLLSCAVLHSEDIKYPFVYIPGMFDNGDTMKADTLLVKNLDSEVGFYYKTYFNDNFNYSSQPIICSSNITGSKYNRLSVANLIGTFRTNISIFLMSDRLFCLMHGRAPAFKNYNKLTNYKGNDYYGTIKSGDREICYYGLIEEIWAKYGKKVYYIKEKNKFRVALNPDAIKSGKEYFYINQNGYFSVPGEIKFNFVVHSSGGIAVRKYIKMCNDMKIGHHINLIINLSVPQKGARMVYSLKKAFPELLDETVNKFFENENKTITVDSKTFKYSELITITKADMLKGTGAKAVNFRKLIGNYILYGIPFDGHKRVLGTDPTLYDLNPSHKLIKMLDKTPLPESVKIYNYKVHEAYAPMFINIGKYLNLGQNDGVVDFKDTDLSSLPMFNEKNVKDIIVAKANHIPFPYIKPVFELKETIDQNYGFLKILLKKKVPKEEGITIITALMKAMMNEFGLDLEYMLKNENYSVIDYFAENPVSID